MVMKNILNDMPLFVEVAKQKSFTAAADILDMPVSTLSRRISTMEKVLGVPLFLRNSRNVELTESGKTFFEHCAYIVENAMSACEALVQNMNAPAGAVRFSATNDSYNFILPALKSFAAAWPQIQLHIRFADRWADLLTEPFDLDMRIGPLPDSSLRARKLESVEHGLYVSPSVLEVYPAPRVPEDLNTIPCMTSLPHPGNIWTLSKGKETRTVTITPAYSFNSMFAALDFALSGMGVVYAAKALVFRQQREGLLTQILPDWTLPDLDVNLVMPNQQLPLRVRLFMDHLTAYSDQLNEELREEMKKNS